MSESTSLKANRASSMDAMVADASRPAPDYAIELLHVTKRFPGIIANDDITLRLERGEIRALLGENGAGKSTLMDVLIGMYQPEEGEIRKDGRTVSIGNPREANDLGIGMVHQHFMLVECFTVLENIMLGSETCTHGMLDEQAARVRLASLCEEYGLAVDPDAIVSETSVGMQQRTEILKMLYRDNDVLVFDEPTAVLTQGETANLLRIMRRLADQGKTILFITHKIAEIMAVADRCTVIRKGRVMGTVNIKDTNERELSRLMVGRDVMLTVEKKAVAPGRPVLEVKGLSLAAKADSHKALNDISLTVREGELVCIAGIDGNGQGELVDALAGLLAPTAGTITLCGEDITSKSVRERLETGMSIIPADRHKDGLILDFSLDKNLLIKRYFQPEFCKMGSILNKASMREYAQRLYDENDIRSGCGIDSITRTMSGGNQQKAIIAREIDHPHRLLIAVQPTRGVDVGAIESIHRTILAEREKGCAVLLVSFELDEVMNLSDRILVMFDGSIVGALDPTTTNVEELGLYMVGARKDEVTQ